jgi:hypothetical protein
MLEDYFPTVRLLCKISVRPSGIHVKGTVLSTHAGVLGKIAVLLVIVGSPSPHQWQAI